MKEPKDKSESEKSWWTEAVKDLTSAGMATYFMTEESIRNYLKEKKFPKEVVGDLLENMGRRKEDAYRAVGKEIGSFLAKLLDSHSIKFEGKVSFEPKNPKRKDTP